MKGIYLYAEPPVFMGGSLYNSLYVSKLLLQASGIQQKIINIHSQNPIFIIIRSNDILGNDNLFEGIINFAKRSYFLGAFCLIRQGVGGLDVVSCRAKIAYEIYFLSFSGLVREPIAEERIFSRSSSSP